MAQSVAGIAPSAVMATGPALIAVYAGDGTWLSYLAAMVVVAAHRAGRRPVRPAVRLLRLAVQLRRPGPRPRRRRSPPAGGWSSARVHRHDRRRRHRDLPGSFLNGIGLSVDGTRAGADPARSPRMAPRRSPSPASRSPPGSGLVLEIISVTAVLRRADRRPGQERVQPARSPSSPDGTVRSTGSRSASSWPSLGLRRVRELGQPRGRGPQPAPGHPPRGPGQRRAGRRPVRLRRLHHGAGLRHRRRR